MMSFGAGSFGRLGPLIWLAFVAGIVLIIAWIIQAGGRGSEDEPLRELRSRFARGDIDAAQFEEMRRRSLPAASTSEQAGRAGPYL